MRAKKSFFKNKAKVLKFDKVVRNERLSYNENLTKNTLLENYAKDFEKEKNSRSQIFILVLIITLIIITSIGLFIYLRKVQVLTNQNTLKSLNEITKQDVSKINNIANEHIRILETIVSEIEENNLKNVNDVFNLFFRNSGNKQFSRICVMYEDGKVYTSDEQIVDLSAEKSDFFVNNEVKVSKTRKSKVNDDEINIYSKTTKLNGKNVAILLVIETNRYEELFIQSIYNGNGNEYIITNEAKIIAKSNKNLEKDDNDIIKVLNGKVDDNSLNKQNMQKMKENIKNNINGEAVYYNNIEKYFVTYQKLDINNWYLVIITKGSVIAQELNQVLKIMFVISILIILIITIFSIYILISQKRKRKKLYNLAYIDPVTTLGNYNYFKEFGQSVIEKEKQNKYIAVIDINNFKNFNKKYGYKQGDKLLKEFAKNLQNNLKGKAIFSRLSSDVFSGIFINISNIQKQAEELIKNLSEIQIEQKIYKISINIGIYKIKNQKSNILESLDKALSAHSRIKADNNIAYLIYDTKLENEIENEQKIEDLMQQALENEEFKIVYQPKISLNNEKMIGAEALVRWYKGNKVIPTNEFIPIFEKNKFILKLDKYIFASVCKDISKWKYNLNIKAIPIISINVSKENFYDDSFIEDFVKIANKYKINTKEIELEITESAILNKDIDILKIINKIKKAGFKISIDDFGTGTSSLSMLQNMPIDTIKIDKIFVDKINLERKNENIIDYIIYMAKKLNLETVSEGVETKEQVKYLKNIGCDIVQGYYYSKPITSDVLLKFKATGK